MNPLLINTYDKEGGAAIATYRIQRALRSIGVNSRLLVQQKKTDDRHVIGTGSNTGKAIAILRPYLEGFINLKARHSKGLFSPASLPDRTPGKIVELAPDLVHLFWVNHGFIRIESLKKITKPIIWTLHDMWPFTGGCHYDDECGRFRNSCGKCPLLNSNREHDLSRQIWSRKNKSWKDLPLVIVATSHWMADMAKASSLFANKRIEVIPNCIDTDVYKPINKETARKAYNLPTDKSLVMFSAFSATSDRRKGHQYLVEALRRISEAGGGDDIELVIIGASRPENPPDLGMKVHYINRLYDEISQVLLYSAADVLVAPSMQENLANTVMESLACGTPVVAFDIGGMPDMIDHQINGYLARPFEADKLASGINWVLNDKERRHKELSLQARRKVEKRYSFNKVAEQYLLLYRDILRNR